MKLAIAFTALAIIATTLVIPLTNIRAQIPAQLPANIPPAETVANGDHLPVHTTQDDRLIITTVTKSGEPPTGPVIILPPEPGKDNGTIVTPDENITAENPGNITIISPGGNVTELPGNITNVGNDTVIITPPDRNVTETPGNVTVISPPLGGNETVPPCTCQNQTQPQPPTTIPPVIISPAPGQNITQVPQPPAANNITTQPLPPVTEGSNQTGNTTGNETQTGPINNATNSNSTEPPHATQLPASLSILPQFHTSNVKYVYNGVNTQWLNR